MKWCVEYSKEQDAFHIETSDERKLRPVNGYDLLGYFDTQEESERMLHYFISAHDHLAEWDRKNISAIEFDNRMLATEELLRREIGNENMHKNQAYQYMHKIMISKVVAIRGNPKNSV